MSPWEFLGWAVAVSVSLIVVMLALAVVTAGLKTMRRGGPRRKTIDDRV